VLEGDRVAGEQRAAPAESRRERDLGALHLDERVAQQLVPGAVEIAAPVEQALGDCELLLEFRAVGRARAIDVGVHCRVRRQEVGEHRQQPVAVTHHGAAFHVEIEDAEELGVRAGVGDQGLAHHHGRRYAVVRVPAEDRVDAAHARGELEVHVHAVVRQQHHHLRALGAHLVHQLLQARFLDAEGPLRDHVARIGDRRVGEGLADHGERNAVHRAQRVGLEDGILEIGGLHVLREELHRRELFLDRRLHALGAVSELPVRGHEVDAQELLRADHVRAFGPQRGGRTLPGVAAVQQQRVRARRAQTLDQRGEVRVAADLAVAVRGALEIEIGEGMRRCAARGDAEMFQERLAHQVRRAALGRAHAEIHARLAEIDGPELRVRVGHVQERYVAERRHLVELVGGLRRARAGTQARARRRGEAQQPEEFTSLHGGILHGGTRYGEPIRRPYRRINTLLLPWRRAPADNSASPEEERCPAWSGPTAEDRSSP
jgi:hypothetical protein